MKKWFTVKMRMAYLGLLYLVFAASATATEAKITNVLTSTFPIHQITRNVSQGRENLRVTLMIPAQLGCPHDYALTPQDMRKLAGARVLIINGQGMEEFLGVPLERANPSLRIIDSSDGIKDLLPFTLDEDEHGDDHQHHDGVNPHLFASPRMAALIAMNIAAGLSRIDPGGAALYANNAEAFAVKMNRLADEFTALGKRLRNNRIVTQHGVFDYLARDMGLVIAAVLQAHAGQEPSAAEMLEIIRTVRKEKVGAVFIEPQYPLKTGEVIAGEAGIPMAILDPAATGPENAPLDYYEVLMRKNLTVLETALGTK